MVKREVSKLEKPIRPFDAAEAWETVDSAEAEATIYRAMGHPLRREILELLNEGPVRQIDLVKSVGKITGKKYDSAALLHHLGILEKAGLVEHKDIPGKKTRIKLLYRTKDVRLQVYRRPKAEALEDRETQAEVS